MSGSIRWINLLGEAEGVVLGRLSRGGSSRLRDEVTMRSGLGSVPDLYDARERSAGRPGRVTVWRAASLSDKRPFRVLWAPLLVGCLKVLKTELRVWPLVYAAEKSTLWQKCPNQTHMRELAGGWASKGSLRLAVLWWLVQSSLIFLKSINLLTLTHALEKLSAQCFKIYSYRKRRKTAANLSYGAHGVF